MILTKSHEHSIDLDFEINNIIRTDQLEKLLLIVPTNRKIRSLKREMVSLSPSKAVSKINLETIGTFSSKIFYVNQRSKSKVLSEAASSVLLRQSFQEVKTKYFSQYQDEIPSGTLQRIRNVISEYKRHGITPEILKIESKNLKSSEKYKAEDITAIYSDYQEKIRQLSVNETGDIYAEVIKNSPIEFTGKFRNIFPGVNLIVINGFDEFTTPEIEIIDLLSFISDSRLFINFDYYKYNPLIFSHLEKCYSKLIKKGFKEITDLSRGSLNEFPLTVRENLFLKRKEKKDLQKNSSVIISAKNRQEEIELIAKEIKTLIYEKQIEPHKICVAFNLIQKYSPVIRDIFSLYGLPFNLTDRYSLSNSSPVIALINFLEILENDYYYKNIFRALSSGYIKIKNVELSCLLKASKELKILYGYERWTSALSDALQHKADEDTEEKFIRKKEYLRTALNSLHTLNSFLNQFNAEMTVNDFRISFMNLINELQIPSNIINDKQEVIEKNIKALNSFIETVIEILSLLEEEFESSHKFPLKYFLTQIRTAVIPARYNVKEKPGFGVQVTTLNEIRGLQFDYLFIAGMVDGDLPTRYSPEIFFSGSYLKQEESHQTEERYHFYQSLCSWNKGLYLTYPLNEQIKELSPSNFLTEFRNIFPVIEKSYENYINVIYTKEELLKLAGSIEPALINKTYGSENIPLDIQKIEEAININNLRSNEIAGDSPYVGNIYNSLDNSEKQWLEELKSRQYSVSQLENYAKCPYKYFAERILKLEQPEEPTEEVEALEMGSILHNIFYEFYKELKKKKIILFQCTDEEFNVAKKLLFSIAESKIEEANFKSPLSFYEKEKILGLNNKKESSILSEFLKQERDKSEGFTPEYFEVGFGKDDTSYKGKTFGENLPDSIKNLKAGEISIRGKIDRVDINTERNEFRIIDYKLGGKKPSREDLETGISLQLPLYMFAANELIKAQLNKDYKPAGADIYSLKYKKGEFGRQKVKELTNKDSSESLIEICLNSVEKYVKLITEGKFHLTELKDRENKVCRFCGFHSICRIEERN